MRGLFGGAPLPLHIPNKEQRELLRPSNYAKIAEVNLRLVVTIANKYHDAGDMEELTQIGALGLVKGIHRFDVEKPTQMSTYLGKCIENEILMYIRYKKKWANNVSMEGELHEDADGNALTFVDTLADDTVDYEQDLEDADNKRLILEYINTLKPRHRDVICMRYGLLGHKPLTQKEVSEELGICQSQVCRLEKAILRNMRTYLETGRVMTPRVGR